ncbi:MAG: hypothetical protein KatS3mg035_0457 [Bacteroidia bacterium]|nr:MAG: hypothetical protein KatS3mg035_0457 [Bacteroidia bacterium]
MLELHLWKHQSQNQIPPVMTADTSAQNQKDNNLRLQLVYQSFIKKIKFNSQQSYLRDYLYYEDSIAQIFSDYLSHQWFSDHYLQYTNPQNFFQFQLQNHYIFPTASNSMILPKTWQRHSFIGTYQYYAPKLKTKYHLTIRQENIQGQWIEPVVNVSAHWNFMTKWYVKTNLGNTYRYPSLNDLYWQIGGNPYLKPEKGLQYEATLTWKKRPLSTTNDLLLRTLSKFNYLVTSKLYMDSPKPQLHPFTGTKNFLLKPIFIYKNINGY